MAPTWEQLRDHNRQSEGRVITGTLHVDRGSTDDVFGVMFAPPDRWRVDDPDGVVRIRNSAYEFTRSPGQADPIRHDVSPHGLSPMTDAPEHLFDSYRHWPAPRVPTSPSPATGDLPDGTRWGVFVGSSMSADPEFEPVGVAQPARIRGRDGWAIRLRRRGGAESVYVFDDATGVVIGRDPGAGYGAVEVSDLVVDVALPDSVFEWNSPFVDETAAHKARQRAHDQKMAELASVPLSLPTYWPGARVAPSSMMLDGDPTNWTVHHHLMCGGFVGSMQRWHRRTHRPFASDDPNDPHEFSWDDDHWTYVVATSVRLSDDDARRVRESVPVVVPPEAMRAAALAEASAAVRPGEVDVARTVFAGAVQVHYGFLGLVCPPDHAMPQIDTAFVGQRNGLCGTAQTDGLYAITGLHTGTVELEIRLEKNRPPVDDRWEEIVEVPFCTGVTDMELWSFNGPIAEIHMPRGTYRIRYSASGMDEAHAADTGDGIDTYELLIWPDEPRSDEVIKKTAQIAEFWHAQAVGRPVDAAENRHT